MIAPDDEPDYNLRVAKPGFVAWGSLLVLTYGLLSANAFWFEQTRVSSPTGIFDRYDSSPPVAEYATRVFYEIGRLDPENLVCLVIAIIINFLFLMRIQDMVKMYGHSRKIALVIMGLVYFSLVPMIMNLFGFLQSFLVIFKDSYTRLLATLNAGIPYGQGSLTTVQDGGGVAFFVCLGIISIYLLKLLFFPRPGIKSFADGLVLCVNPWRILWGSKVLNWSDIRQVSIVRTKKKKDALVLTTDAGKYFFPWDLLAKELDPTELINDLRTHAPDAMDDSVSFRNESTRDAATYTELWLKYFTSSSPRARSGQLESGDKLHNGHYEIAGQLGSGGQGTAYLASCPGMTVVLKEYIMPVHRGDAIFQQSMRKLQQEALILERIEHPNIVRIIDTFVEDHRGYLVLEYVEGTTLKQLVQEQGAQSSEMVLDIAVQICDILEHLHSMDPPIIHRDLTPDNLILQPSGKLKLVDFNVAHQLESAATATVVGKHAYLPPEQFRGKPTTQSDIYAFGGTLFYLLTGNDPAPLSSSRPSKFIAGVDKRLDDIIAKATALESSKRSANAAEIKEEVLKICSLETRKRFRLEAEHDSQNRIHAELDGSEGVQGNGSEGAEGNGSEGAEGNGSEGAEGNGSEGVQGNGSEGAEGNESEGVEGNESEEGVSILFSQPQPVGLAQDLPQDEELKNTFV